MTSNELRHILNDSQALQASHLPDLMTLSSRCPSATVFHLLILKCMYKQGDLRFSSELQRRALYIPDLSILHRILQGENELSSVMGASKTASKDTADPFDLIENFLALHPDTGEPEALTVEKPYAERLDENEALLIEGLSPTPDSEVQSEDAMTIIDSFLNKGEEAEKITPTTSHEADEQSPKTNEETSSLPQPEELYTETLARIYIKQGKYASAKRIIKSIHLKYPKKSSYFAEQLSYLEKLVINS